MAGVICEDACNTCRVSTRTAVAVVVFLGQTLCQDQCTVAITSGARARCCEQA